MPDPIGSLEFIWPFLAVYLVSFLVGGIPFGVILTLGAGLGDVRKIGSGSIGATNVLRTGNKFLAALTLILDAGKGALPVWLCATYLTQDFAVIAGGSALLGHMFPFWLRLDSYRHFISALVVTLGLGVLVGVLLTSKGADLPIGLVAVALLILTAWGGKGIATGFGILLVLNWEIGVIAGAVWLIAALLFRFSSLAALLALTSAPVIAFFLSESIIDGRYISDLQRTDFFAFAAVAIALRHIGNIRRLWTGQEPRIGGSKSAPPPDETDRSDDDAAPDGKS